MMRKRVIRFPKSYFVMILLFTLIPLSAHAQVPLLLNYQGHLTDSTGLPLDGNHLMNFYLYNQETGGDYLWTEQQDVMVTGGIFVVQLGSVTAFSGDEFDHPGLYLEIEIFKSGPGWETLAPRIQLTSTAFTLRAEYAYEADTLDGQHSADFATALHQHSGDEITSGTVDETRIDPDIARDSEITWSNLLNIPPDIADGDQIGITAENDPTVDFSVKDGVSWGELSNIPAGFADGVDNEGSGDITSVTAGLGLAGGGTNGDVTLNIEIPFSISQTAGGTLFKITNTGSTHAIMGKAEGISGYGLYGTALGYSGKGVFGFSEGTEGVGVEARAYGTSGRGVYAFASGSNGKAIKGEVWGESAISIHGLATGSTGKGIFGEASSTETGTNYGGYFTAAGTAGLGVYGEAKAYGGYFRANNSNGQGVFGYAPYVGVSGMATNSSGIGVWGWANGASAIGVVGFGGEYDFYAEGPGANYGAFTGSHEVRFSQETTNDIQPGMIVSATGRTERRITDSGNVSLSSTLPTVMITQKAMDKAVLGILVSNSNLPKHHWYDYKEGERFGVVNALGEGRMWICDYNGNVEPGDYITSSAIPGYGQKQNDDLLHSYTVGKAIETVDWDTVTETVEYDSNHYRVYLIAVVYTSG